MKPLFVFASVMVVLFLAVPNNVEAQKRKATKTIEGTISSFECGDNCYLTITDNKGKEHKGLCNAPLCNSWVALQMMPDSYKGKRVTVTIGKGKRFTGAGAVVDTMDAFIRIQLTESEPIRYQERGPDACTFCGVWEYVDNFSGLGLKYYLKLHQAGAGKFKLITGQYQDGEIYWAEPYIRKANGIYLTMVNGSLVGRFVSSNFYATHGTEFTYKITCAIQSNNKLSYSVWSSIRGETEKFVATKISN